MSAGTDMGLLWLAVGGALAVIFTKAFHRQLRAEWSRINAELWPYLADLIGRALSWVAGVIGHGLRAVAVRRAVRAEAKVRREAGEE